MAAAPDYRQINRSYFMLDKQGNRIHMRRKHGLARNFMDRTEYYERLINVGDLVDLYYIADHTVEINQYTMNEEQQLQAREWNDAEKIRLAEMRRKVFLIEAEDNEAKRFVYLVNNLHFFHDGAVSFELIWNNKPSYLRLANNRKPLFGDLRVNKIAYIVEYHQAETAYITLQNNQLERTLQQHIWPGAQDLVPTVMSFLRE